MYDDRVDREPAAPEIVPALDGVRGVAILLVLAHNLSPFESKRRLIDVGAGLTSDFGWVGVQLFFVLSGYLISGILLDTRGAPRYYRAFFGRRVLRIFPLYYGVLLLCLVILPALGLAPAALLADREQSVWLWTYLINWAEPLGAPIAVFPHFWSLAVEEQFYLVWPFVVAHAGPRRLLNVALVLVVVAFASRLALRLAGASDAGPYMFTICRMDALALGGAVAAILRIPELAERVVRRRRAIAIAAGVLFALVAVATRGYPRTSFRDQTFGYTILAVVFAALVLLAALDRPSATLRGAAPAGGAGPCDDRRGRSWIGAVLSNAVLRSFGKYSYGIYMFHQPLNLMIGAPVLHSMLPRGAGLKAGFAYMAIVTAASYALAVISYHGYEKHFLALKRHFTPGRAAST
jgi:peptidoglycan/LPS O-acetylase OafA/YrhL